MPQSATNSLKGLPVAELKVAITAVLARHRQAYTYVIANALRRGDKPCPDITTTQVRRLLNGMETEGLVRQLYRRANDIEWALPDVAA